MRDQGYVVYCNRGFFPVFYGFCPSEKAWKREMKRIKVSEPYPTQDARMTSFDNPKSEVICLVTINEKFDTLDDANAIVGLIVHEAVHVWQKITETIGERYPSIEFEAYSIQVITQELLFAYAETRGLDYGKKRPG